MLTKKLAQCATVTDLENSAFDFLRPNIDHPEGAHIWVWGIKMTPENRRMQLAQSYFHFTVGPGPKEAY